DPAGVFISLLCYQLTVGDTIHAWQDFLSRGFWGGLIGVIGGIILSQLMKRKWIPEESRNIAVLAFAIAIFSVSDLVAHESGLLSVTIAGLLLGYMDIPEIKKLKVYKAELTELLIGLLFVLLAASLDLSKFIDMGWKGVVIVLIIMFIVRPINIFVSTFGSKLSLNEKLFLSWIAPRGIVAASMASLFSLNLAEQWAGDPAKIAQAELLEAYTYAVIAGTVIFQGFTAKLVGKALGVLEPQPSGWLIIGAHKLGRQLANFISKRGKHVVLIDSNVRNIALAKRNGLTALNENALKMDMEDYPELYGIGNILAITENSDLNILICQRFHGESAGLYRWESAVTADGHEEDEDHHGLPVWNLIDAAMMKALDFEEDNSLKIQSVNLATVKHTERVLLYCKDGDITPRIAEQDGECEIISYNPVHVEMGISTKEEWILITDSTNLNDLFDTMLGKLLGYFPDLDSKMIQDRLLKQEQDYSSLIGYGVALPHFYVDGLSESVVMIAKLETPLKDLHSKEEIHFIFLVLSPSDQPKNHLQALSEISSFIMVEERRQDMFLAKTTEELIAVFFPGR
ncbi:MAG: PTS sugar transporter subunit IIA, partial [Lentisphaeria bacterium]|nr:cation:proton antiporter [Lentisphaeria bacterium]NQZ69672.1 PTS sugar transporter subunit IIA [Lentisphaeria bacterium]